VLLSLLINSFSTGSVISVYFGIVKSLQPWAGFWCRHLSNASFLLKAVSYRQLFYFGVLDKNLREVVSAELVFCVTDQSCISILEDFDSCL
jgi:hypothetical protein